MTRWSASAGSATRTALLWCLAARDVELLDEGALRATAQLRLVPDGDGVPVALAATHRLLRDPERPQDLLGLWGLWGLIAAAGWSGPAVRALLTAHLDDHRPEVREIARASLDGRWTVIERLL